MKTLNALAVTAGLLLAGCATAPAPSGVAAAGEAGGLSRAQQLQATAARPIEGNGGKYMSPFTSDGVTAEWVIKSMKVEAGGAIAGAAGTIAGQQLMSNIPFVGGFLGNKAGKAMGRSVALKSIGGEAFLKSFSDQSFDTLQAMAENMFAFHSDHADYAAIVKATNAIYPDFEQIYLSKYPRPKPGPKAAPTPTPFKATT